MARYDNSSQRSITATELKRNFSVVVRRLRQKREHTVIKSKGTPVAVILSMAEYEKLTALERKRAGIAAFKDFSRNLGREVERLGLTEEEALEELEETKREVFEERYGKPKR